MKFAGRIWGIVTKVSEKKIKIFVTHTPNRNDFLWEHPYFCHVTAGSDFQSRTLSRGLIQDNTGNHISGKNKSYCELTTQYWAWKNAEADYYGFCHYRRYFSFAEKHLGVADCGCVMRTNISDNLYCELGMDPQHVRRIIEDYDFIIAEGIPVAALKAANLRQHYKQGKGLHEKDLDLMLEGIGRLYPELYPIAQSYIKGKLFYPCNMFIAKRDLFEAYSKFLFDVLAYVEDRIDPQNYSREGYRTLGHLGERLLGIYYLYLKQTQRFRLKELQPVQIQYTDDIFRDEVFDASEIPIVLAVNAAYVPILSVCLHSVLKHTNRERTYHVFVLHDDIAANAQRDIESELQTANFQITFVNVAPYISDYVLKAKAHISKETYYRFLIPDLFSTREKVLYLDCDTIICDDVGLLYDTDLGENLLGAVRDVDFVGQYNGANADTCEYCDRVLKLSNPLKYFQAGVLLFHVAKMREFFSIEQLFAMAENTDYKYSDQDILNVLCQDHVVYLPVRWNVLTDNLNRMEQVISFVPHDLLDEYENARKDPAIIHYAGADKPWSNPAGDYAKQFWKVARESDFYESLMMFFQGNDSKHATFRSKTINILRVTAKRVLPEGSWIRRKIGAFYWKYK